MISGPGFEQQIEHQLQAQDAGGGTRSSGKRSHLKRQLKAPTKLSKEKEPDDGCAHKTYGKGLFEKRFKQLVSLPPPSLRSHNPLFRAEGLCMYP